MYVPGATLTPCPSLHITKATTIPLQELPALSGMELSMAIAAVSELQYRPSDAWLAAFSDEVRRRLPEMRNQDLGLTVAALAALAAPLDEGWLADLTREAGRKWWSMDLDGMALLLHGLAQYGCRCAGGGGLLSG